MRTYMHTCKQCTYATHIRTHTHTHTHIYSGTQTHTYTCTHTYIHAHTCIHAQTHIHTHTPQSEYSSLIEIYGLARPISFIFWSFTRKYADSAPSLHYPSELHYLPLALLKLFLWVLQTSMIPLHGHSKLCEHHFHNSLLHWCNNHRQESISIVRPSTHSVLTEPRDQDGSSLLP